jgi:predicted phosphodiesterase
MSGPLVYCGDTHGQHTHVVRMTNQLDASAVILLSDLQAKRPLADELAGLKADWSFIAGNHEGDADVFAQAVIEPAIQHRNLHGRVVVMRDGQKVAGLDPSHGDA